MTGAIKKPSRGWYVLAAVLGILAIAIPTVLTFSLVLGLSRSMTRVVVPGRQEIELTEPGGYTVFHEHRSTHDGKVYSTRGKISGLECKLYEKKTGREVPLTPPRGSSTYTIGGREGFSVLAFRIETPGTYVFEAEYPQGKPGAEAVFGIGRSFLGKMFITIFASLASLFGLGAAAVLIFVLVLVKRSRAKPAAEGAA